MNQNNLFSYITKRVFKKTFQQLSVYELNNTYKICDHSLNKVNFQVLIHNDILSKKSDRLLL